MTHELKSDLFPKKTTRVSKRPDPLVLAEQYKTHTAPELAKRYGVATSTIYKWVYRMRQNPPDVEVMQ